MTKITSAATKKTPKQARARARVDAILTATEQLLVAEGPNGLTTTAIARAADIPVGSVYQYFADRDDILEQLYHAAYDHVIGQVADHLETLSGPMDLKTIIHGLLTTFWQEARAHTTFRPLTRWANSSHSLWEVTPGVHSSLDDLIARVLEKAGVSVAEARQLAVMKTVSTTVSILVDQAIEEQDEILAEQLIDELAHLVSSYLS
ncbi:TetR/AcrR family transcriptional regulator [Kordiimonas marina]|uniref:TetR/AcrR family transcriptional regulator n=1 Tax=Kordiimonas marina TaxID=2872312 RepID=UPI001FF44A0F|nr:TetR/AcrR family transcriptional regulator [Kordiimonas marina]